MITFSVIEFPKDCEPTVREITIKNRPYNFEHYGGYKNKYPIGLFKIGKAEMGITSFNYDYQENDTYVTLFAHKNKKELLKIGIKI